MPQHEWGDDFDWESLYECVHWFPIQLHRYARFPLTSCKEKYGTMRLEWLGCTHKGIIGFIRPGHIFFPAPEFLYKFNGLSEIIAHKIGLRRLLWKYQILIFNLVTLRAYYKWPNIIHEITDEDEFAQWLYRPIKKKIGFVCSWQTTNKDNKWVWVDPEFHPKQELPDDIQ